MRWGRWAIWILHCERSRSSSRRRGRAKGKIKQRRSGDLGVDQGLALGHGAGEAIPSLVNVGING